MAQLQLLTQPIIGPLLPSPSTLTGTFRPQTAAVYLEQSLAEARARLAYAEHVGEQEASASHSPQPAHGAPPPPAREPASALPAAAPHMHSPQLATPSAAKEAVEEASGQHPPLLPAAAATAAAVGSTAAATSPSRTPPLALPAAVRPGTHQSRGGGTPGAIHTATAAAAARLATPTGPPQPGSSSTELWAGPPEAQPHPERICLPSLHTHAHVAAAEHSSTEAHAGSDGTTPPPGGGRPGGGGGGNGDVPPPSQASSPGTPQRTPPQRPPTLRWWPGGASEDPSSRRAIAGSAPTSSASEGLEARWLPPSGRAAGALVGAAVASDADGGPSSQPLTPLLRQSAPAALVPTGLGLGPGGRSGRESFSRGGPTVGGAPLFQHTATKRALLTADGPTAAALGANQPGKLRISRGMVFSVFQELDEFDAGRITYSAFEQAACKIGMRPVQARCLFEQLDPWSRGYTTMREWSGPQMKRQMDAFTRLYIQATRGRNGRPRDATLIRSVPMAVQMAMLKLQLKRSGRAVSQDRLVQAFAYMDSDKSGTLSGAEVEDALNALGIFVTKEVIDTIMRTFDKDGNGNVNYYEFVRSIYPTVEPSAHRR